MSNSPTAKQPITLSDWYLKQKQLKEDARQKRHDGFNIRNNARTVRNETSVKTKWGFYMSNEKLSERLTEIAHCQDTFTAQLERLEIERDIINKEKLATELQLEHLLNDTLPTTKRCLSMRATRRDSELTYDEGSTELDNELRVINDVKKLLSDRISSAVALWNCLCETIIELKAELQDKNKTLDLDRENLELTRDSANISLKPDALRIPKDSVTHKMWLEHTTRIKQIVDNQLIESVAFRERLQLDRKKANNDITAQHESTNFALRKRIYLTKKSRNELQWQIKKLLKEMESLKNEIAELKNALENKYNYIKCAETRLENRTYRPGFELCNDNAYEGLKEEVLELRAICEELRDRIKASEQSYHEMECLLQRIEKNLSDKEHTLTTDVMCLDIRSCLKDGGKSCLDNETDRNIALTGLSQELPKSC